MKKMHGETLKKDIHPVPSRIQALGSRAVEN